MTNYVKLDWDIDLSKYAYELMNRPGEDEPKSRSIIREELFQIVPELAKLDKILSTKNLGIYGSSVMSINPGTYGTLHIDWEEVGTIPQTLRFNIPILNGDQMTTRWYDLSGLPYDRIDWKFDRANFSEADLWFVSNPELLTTKHCVDSLKLDAPCLFNSGSPHNVDGRHCEVIRTILSASIVVIDQERLARWDERQMVIDAVAELVQNS
jgi:hypothetical protein